MGSEELMRRQKPVMYSGELVPGAMDGWNEVRGFVDREKYDAATGFAVKGGEMEDG